MRRTVGLAAATAAIAACTMLPTARAQVLPEPPPPPSPPEQLDPLLELLGGPGGVVTEPGCAALGTLLGLGVVVIPGVPGTIESTVGLPVPPEAQTEFLTAANTLLYVQGTGCGLLPIATERTVCAVDEQLLAQTQPVDDVEVPGAPVNPTDLIPEPVPPAGALVDTVRYLGALGAPGAEEVVKALEENGDCELRERTTNVPPPPPPEGGPPASPTPPDPDSGVARPPPSTGAGAPRGTGTLAPPGDPSSEVAAPGPVNPGNPGDASANVSTSLPVDALPWWLMAAAMAALLWFTRHAIRPRAGL